MNEKIPEFINPEENKGKEDIRKIFDLYPGLAEIGSQEQYQEYLKTIFPESKFPTKIFQNQSESDFENFINEKKSKVGTFGPGHYFSDFGEDFYGVDSNFFKKIVVLNIKNPKYFEGRDFMKKVYALIDERGLDPDDYDIVRKVRDEYEEQLKTEYDAFIGGRNNNVTSETTVFDSAQIHILGSKSDLENFKKFIAEQN